MINTTKQRLAIVSILTLLPAIPLAARLFYLQTFRHSELAGKAASTTSTPTMETRLRGTIRDRSGVALAESLPTYTCAISKRDTNSPRQMIPLLARELELPEAKIRAKWNSAKNFFYVKTKIEPAVYENLMKQLRARKLSGAILSRSFNRVHPSGELAKDLLGSVSYDHTGVSGIEKMYDETLRGKVEKHLAYKDRYGQIIYNPDLKTEEDLRDVTLAIDSRIQYYTETALDRAVAASKAKAGFAIVQNPYTGEILAAATCPRLSGQAWPFQMTYEPGSTFKAITVSAALEENTIAPADTFDCTSTGKWEIFPGVVIGDDHKTGVLDITGILAQSSNICAAKIGLKLGKKSFYTHMRQFGLGTKTTLNFPGESKGIIRSYETWRDIDLAVASYGHGVSVTPIQLVTAYSASANGGTLMEPILVKRVTGSGGSLISENKPHVLRQVLSKKTLAELIPMLEEVVKSGTGWRAKIRGYSIAGKTGTSKKLVGGRYSSNKHIGSFAGFFPARNPRFTILVGIDEPNIGYSGGETAAPAFAEIAQQLLADNTIEPDLPQELDSRDYQTASPQTSLRSKYPPVREHLSEADEKHSAENNTSAVLRHLPVTEPIEKFPEGDEGIEINAREPVSQADKDVGSEQFYDETVPNGAARLEDKQ
ncbi:MAG: penicillin-binding protein 2 [Elusimicrobiaceae bacterium]|nr:penicillin-binding protein 2 [Elusimicrobiaceae bacterium]